MLGLSWGSIVILSLGPIMGSYCGALAILGSHHEVLLWGPIVGFHGGVLLWWGAAMWGSILLGQWRIQGGLGGASAHPLAST